jgi:hypothetical protein
MFPDDLIAASPVNGEGRDIKRICEGYIDLSASTDCVQELSSRNRLNATHTSEVLYIPDSYLELGQLEILFKGVEMKDTAYSETPLLNSVATRIPDLSLIGVLMLVILVIVLIYNWWRYGKTRLKLEELKDEFNHLLGQWEDGKAVEEGNVEITISPWHKTIQFKFNNVEDIAGLLEFINRCKLIEQFESLGTTLKTSYTPQSQPQSPKCMIEINFLKLNAWKADRWKNWKQLYNVLFREGKKVQDAYVEPFNVDPQKPKVICGEIEVLTQKRLVSFTLQSLNGRPKLDANSELKEEFETILKDLGKVNVRIGSIEELGPNHIRVFFSLKENFEPNEFSFEIQGDEKEDE